MLIETGIVLLAKIVIMAGFIIPVLGYLTDSKEENNESVKVKIIARFPTRDSRRYHENQQRKSD